MSIINKKGITIYAPVFSNPLGEIRVAKYVSEEIVSFRRWLFFFCVRRDRSTSFFLVRCRSSLET